MHTADYEDPGKWSALVLALLMHALLAGALLVSVKWQTRPQPVMAELWTPQDMPQISEPAPPEAPPPVEAPPPPPPPVDKAEPPRPAPAPPPEIKLKADKKAKEKAPPDSKKPAKAPSFEDALADEEAQINRLKANQDRQRRLDEESRMLKQAREEQENQRRSAARTQAQATYTDRIKGKIRGNLVQPPNLKGNPVALFLVTQLPSGEVLEVKLRRSSGNPLYDDAVERAIRKSSPLPRPDDSSLFARDLVLTFCPDEERGCSR